MTYSQLHRAALTLASGLLANDIQPGSTVLTLIPNGGEYAILLYLCTLMRLTFASLDPTALDASRVEELRDLMQGINPGVVVVPDESGARAIDSLTESGGLPRPFGISLAGDHVNGWKTLLSLMTDARSSPMDEFALLEQAREDDPNRIHSILFTSGTSAGRPKGCPQRVASMTHVLHHLSWLISRKNSTRVLQQAHNSRAIAPAHTLQTWRKGGAVVMANASFAIEDTVEAILHHGVTFIVLSPAMVHALAHELLSRPESVDSVRTIHLGGDAVTKDVLMKCAALFPKAKVCISHGMTEGLGFFEWPFLDTPLSQIPFFGEICPTGAVAAGTKLRLWDADKQMVTKRGQPGELHVSCESIIRHYHGGAGSSSFYEDEKGRWFITGDISIMNDNGLVFILGRSKDVIKRAGTTIMPIALESSIEKYTGSQVSILHCYLRLRFRKIAELDMADNIPPPGLRCSRFTCGPWPGAFCSFEQP